MRGAAGGLKDLKESDKSCKGVSQHALHLGKPRAADSIAPRIPPGYVRAVRSRIMCMAFVEIYLNEDPRIVVSRRRSLNVVLDVFCGFLKRLHIFDAIGVFRPFPLSF